ncbi:MAG: hypothetical protein ACE5JL_16640, partial [Dehalococcoidia bacterium]
MRIIVCVKEVLDPDGVNAFALAGRLQIDPETKQVRGEGIPLIMNAYDDIEQRRATLQSRQRRLQEMYEWGHKSREDYLKEYEAVQRELGSLRPTLEKDATMDRLADFLSNVAAAWDVATPEEQREML